MSTSHATADLLRRYAAGEPAPAGQDVWWAVEAHLESCVDCRAALGDAVARHSPATVRLLARVHDGLAAPGPQMPVRRRPHAPRRWAAPTLVPRLAMTVLVVLAALGLDLVGGGRFPSLVLLLAPVAPLVAVAAAWSRGDPAHELVVATPRAGLELVLRRTAAVLAVVVPALGAAGWAAGASPARWLLPCLAFTLGALALGERFGVRRAATALGAGWVLVVVAPSLVRAEVPAVLAVASAPVWAALAGVAALTVLSGRRTGYTGLRSLR